jgi:hypothetical protein
MLEACWEVGISWTDGTPPEVWPARRDLTTFQSWFEVTFHSMIVDLSDDVLEHEELSARQGPPHVDLSKARWYSFAFAHS